MITQGMVGEVETAMLRAFGRTNSKIVPMAQREKNFLSSASYKEEFVKEFMNQVQDRKPHLELEIEKGGYRDVSRLAVNVHRLVESKVRNGLTQRLLTDKGVDETTMLRLVREVKTEMRNLFYENYFGG
ncbi:MAG: hypothetical protein AABX04_07150 [Nanoarchaeota archaeon]